MTFRVRVRAFAAKAVPPRLFAAPDRARVLVYHSVSEDPLNPFAVSPASFHAQMAHLRAHRNVVPLAALAAALASGRPVPAGAVAVTFDDGYLDNYEAAFPVLAKFSIPATIFLVAGSVRMAGQPAPGGDAEIAFMTWEQAAEMARAGITFGSHTMTHPSLSGLPAAKLAAELRNSKSVVEERLGRKVDAIAYPYGTHRDVDASVLAETLAAGYTHGCMAVNGTVGAETDVYAIPRTKIEFGDDMTVFRRALEGSLDVFTLLDRARKLQGARTPEA
jgi:peptidoglycan/xylan/chitin deacetylase (PgdA/CDA1 family)